MLSMFATACAESPEVQTQSATKLRPGLARAAVSDGAASSRGECRSVCEDDVLSDDVCISTRFNPVPNGEVWMYERDGWRFGCCALGHGACKVCCPPSEEDRQAFEDADIHGMVRELFDGTGADLANFDDESNVEDPWKFFSGTCLTLSNFTIISQGNMPIAGAMRGIVSSGTRSNGRTRNGFFFTDEGLYHEMSPLSWAGAGSITYRVLGYDNSGEGPGFKRVVELPWQLAPHGEAIFAELATEPGEYGLEDKIAYRLIGPYMGEVLVKATCCTPDELTQYEEVSVGAVGFLMTPDPPVRYTRTAEQCNQMAPAYERVQSVATPAFA